MRSTLNIVDFDDSDTSNLVCVRYQVLTAASMKFRVFWDILPCSQIDVGRQYIPEHSEFQSNLYFTVGVSVCNFTIC
jgi:hypothetical protein